MKMATSQGSCQSHIKVQSSSSLQSWMYLLVSAVSILLVSLLIVHQVHYFDSVKGFELGALPPVLLYIIALTHFILAIIYFVSSDNFPISRKAKIAHFLMAVLVGMLFYQSFVGAYLGLQILVALRVFSLMWHVLDDEYVFCFRDSAGQPSNRALYAFFVIGLALMMFRYHFDFLQTLFGIWTWVTPVFVLFLAFGLIKTRLFMKSLELFYLSALFYCVVVYPTTRQEIILIGTAVFLYHVITWYIIYFFKLRDRKKTILGANKRLWKNLIRTPIGFVLLAASTHILLWAGFKTAAGFGIIYPVGGNKENLLQTIYFVKDSWMALGLFLDQRFYSFWAVFHAVMSLSLLGTFIERMISSKTIFSKGHYQNGRPQNREAS